MDHFFLSIGEEGNDFFHSRVLDSLKFTCVSYAYSERDPVRLYSVKNIGVGGNNIFSQDEHVCE